MAADRRARVQEMLERLRRTSPSLVDEIQASRVTPGLVTESVGEGGPADSQLTLESIVMRKGRPVLQVSHDEALLEFRDADSEFWRERLKAARGPLVNAIRAVGRVEVSNHPNFRWLGTGWLVQPDIIVTNRHVAAEFGRRRGEAFVFRSGVLGPMGANIDFVEEFGRTDSLEMKLREILHIEDDGGPDLAFLRVEPAGAALPAHLVLSTREPRPQQEVAVIGYPARDSRIPEIDVMEAIFGDVFDKKRLAPGELREPADGHLTHDCSTLGGNSGSVVLDLASGEALGVHFAGAYLKTNYAVPAAVVADRLSRIGRTESGGHVVGPITVTAAPAATPAGTAVGSAVPTVTSNPRLDGGTSISCVIPIRVHIEIGGPDFGQATVSGVPGAPTVRGGGLDAVEAAIDAEGVADDYRDRKGYDPVFLGKRLRVPLPKIVKDAKQIVTFQNSGAEQSELKYEHFSVVMHRARRMCFYSAVNIDGTLSKRTIRTDWLLDPRIPRELQIKGECYGNAPKYSRGHMTRREDPAWGTRAQADRGCADSMHVTNAVPQMQTFNAGVWLSLEDYALQHARQDDQRLTVITGPIFTSGDPVQFGVTIPKAFWKIIAFVHDKTGALTATGYSISQEDDIPDTEFVFGAFGTHQRSLAWIESSSGLSFGSLTDHDPMKTANEALDAPSRPLESLDRIRFT